MPTEFACMDAHFRHMGQVSKQISVHLSLLCGLRTGEVAQSCLTDVLGVSPYGRQVWETTDNLKVSVGMEIT